MQVKATVPDPGFTQLWNITLTWTGDIMKEYAAICTMFVRTTT